MCFEEPTATGCEYDVTNEDCIFHTDALHVDTNGRSKFRCLVFEDAGGTHFLVSLVLHTCIKILFHSVFSQGNSALKVTFLCVHIYAILVMCLNFCVFFCVCLCVTNFSSTSRGVVQNSQTTSNSIDHHLAYIERWIIGVYPGNCKKNWALVREGFKRDGLCRK